MAILQERAIDFIRHGYRFSEKLRADSRDARADSRVPMIFAGKNALLVRGKEGVRLFYDNSRIQRGGAMPKIVGGGLFGKGSVHGLDDEAHLARKATFLKAVHDPTAVQLFLEGVRAEWQRILDNWKDGDNVYDASVQAIGRAGIVWAGFRPEDEKLSELAVWEAEIVDGFGVAGPAKIREKIRRKQLDAWFTEQFRKARAGEIEAPEGSPFQLIKDHVEHDGTQLSDHVAAVEVQNAFRPAIAVARFCSFLALALHQNPQWRQKVAKETRERGTTIGGEVSTAVAQEVRRFYPFVPLLPSVARHDFEYDGILVKKGERVAIDIYGTLHDPTYWTNADSFDPNHFLGTDMDESEVFIPQGGGDVVTGHRCPGEDIAVGILAITAAELSVRDFTVPPQNLKYDLGRMPTKPATGVKLTGMSPQQL